MGISHFGQVVFGGYAFVELVQTYSISQAFRAISMHIIKNCSGCARINHLLDVEQ